MPGGFDSWESYFYPETINPVTGNGTLRNLFDERDPDVLRRLEYGSTAQRGRELTAGEIDVARTYDAAHVRAIHRHLFADVYEWAGEYRTVDMFKGGPRGFAEVGSGEIERYLDDVHDHVVGTDWARLDRDGFADRAAEVFAYLNQAHPFREGNGRASKVFMEHLAERSAFTFGWDRVTPGQWNEASRFSGPDRFSYEPVPDSLVPVFQTIAVDRPVGTPAAPGQDQTVPARAGRYAAGYPRPPGTEHRRAPAIDPAPRPRSRGTGGYRGLQR